MARPVTLALLLVMATMSSPVVTPLAAQPPVATGAAVGAAAPASSQDEPSDFEYDLERVRDELARQGSGVNWNLPEGTPVFRVDIQSKMPGIEAIVGDLRDLRRGPWRASPYHEEFLNMVTPPEVRNSFTNSELLQVLATGLAGGLALQGITSAIKNYVHGNRTREACEAVRTTLSDLNRDRVAAGLEPVFVPECP